MTTLYDIKLKSIFIALALTFSGSLCAQSLYQAKEAMAKGDYVTALAGFKKLAEQGNTKRCSKVLTRR